jgi:hypothetical protein
MSKDIGRPCERCGNLRWLGTTTGNGAFLVAAVLACMLVGALIRIRCVRCEPAWRTKAWKLAGRDLDG